jgi:hypothetical protein
MENYNEIWTEMWDFPNYEISNYGRVRNAKTGKVLKIRQDGKEYRMVCLYYDKKAYTKRVGRYVWMSFNNQFCKYSIDHINQNSGDDRLENLRCITMRENYDARKPIKKLNKYNLTNKDKGYIHKSITDGTETTWTIMKKYGIPINYVQQVMKRKSWSKYATEL